MSIEYPYLIEIGPISVLCRTAPDALNFLEVLKDAPKSNFDTCCNATHDGVSSPHDQEHLAHSDGPSEGHDQ